MCWFDGYSEAVFSNAPTLSQLCFRGKGIMESVDFWLNKNAANGHLKTQYFLLDALGFAVILTATRQTNFDYDSSHPEKS